MRDQLRRVGEDLSKPRFSMLPYSSSAFFSFSLFPPLLSFSSFFLDLVDETPRDGPRKPFPKKGIINNWQRHYLTEINRVKYPGEEVQMSLNLG
ncbi:hypothetical protein BDV33DRAFT_39530 [Aspergillus novoparasiticus]|uniref:Uncharacterized protein n=1 Tax=Aspergillus novoparasiticus TaxID=986946 RepID=A0A5N6F101_9EURO|nr:hypothetical protein BDV33DRAFT_39530 [Aspergillus novoparasiticus]